MDILNFLKYFSRIVTLLLVLPLHEAAHAFVAYKFGDDTAARQGRLTINPFAHLDPIGSLLIVLTGFGWAKPVPINPLRMKKYRAGISLTALAGPVSNLLAAFASAVIYSLILMTKSGVTAIVSYNIAHEISPLYCAAVLMSFLVEVNVGLAIFNLIPLPPLDGFNVLRYFTSERFDRWFYTHQREIQIGFLLVILALSWLPSSINPLYHARNFISDLIWKSVSWIPVYGG